MALPILTVIGPTQSATGVIANGTAFLFKIDQGYLAALDHLQAGEFKQLPVRDFATESWKRIAPPTDLQVTRVAVLATVAQKGYAQKSLLDQSALSSR